MRRTSGGKYNSIFTIHSQHICSFKSQSWVSSCFQPSELSGNCGAILFSVVWTSLEYSATTCGGSLLPVIADSSICSLSTGYLQASVCKVGCKNTGHSHCDSCFLEQQVKSCPGQAARALLAAKLSRENASS